MSRKSKLLSNAATYLFALLMLPGAIMNIVQPDIAVQMAATLGIPTALLTLVGIWKVLGVAALLSPGLARLKEWAFAGFFFDLTGAAFLHGAAGDAAGIAPPLVLAGLLVVAYVMRNRFAHQASSDAERSFSAVSPQTA